jgi:hypothetical protein
MKAQYKIVKKMSVHAGILIMRYYAYKRWLGVFWRSLGWEFELEGAEKLIREDRAKKKIKPEIVGYWH